jgi:hypothetical protein
MDFFFRDTVVDARGFPERTIITGLTGRRF